MTSIPEARIEATTADGQRVVFFTMPELQCAAVAFPATGETREQTVAYGVNFHAKWRETVAKRIAKLDAVVVTPLMVLPRSR